MALWLMGKFERMLRMIRKDKDYGIGNYGENKKASYNFKFLVKNV